MAGVSLRNIRKRYGENTVIENLDLEIRDEEFMVLVGPSGCGKSTLLRMVAGLEEITAGTITIGDRVVNDIAPKDRDVAMVFQNYALYPHMSVRDNLQFGLKMRKTPREERRQRVTQAAATLGIEELLDRKPRQLSGGQRQRVAVGRAIVRQPAVFLFDEPLSNLDATLRVQMRAEITKLQQRLKTTTIYVTHDQVEAMTMGDRIAVMNEGEVMQLGTPLELYERPANLFVAGFIGTPPMNILRGSVEDGGATIVVSGLPVPISPPVRDRVANCQVVMIGIRPEKIVEGGGTVSGSGNLVPTDVTVEIVEPLGHEVIVHGRMGGAPLVAKVDPHRAPEPGSTIRLSLDQSAFHIFDVESGARLA